MSARPARPPAPPGADRRLPVLVGALAALALVGLGLFVPFDARHSAPFGFRLTFDSDRGIAVPGGWVTANYPNFDRVDLDLRAYSPGATYDLTVYVLPALGGEEGTGDPPPLRTARLRLDYEAIRHDKPTGADAFTTVRFDPIEDSAGERYYVSVEKGPRNRDEVVTLWSIKSYSRVTGREVLAALLADPPGERAEGAVRAGLTAALVLVPLACGWLVGATVAVARRSGRGTDVEAVAARVSLTDLAASDG